MPGARPAARYFLQPTDDKRVPEHVGKVRKIETGSGVSRDLVTYNTFLKNRLVINNDNFVRLIQFMTFVTSFARKNKFGVQLT